MAYTLQIGQPAPDFNLLGVDGRTYSLANLKDAKLLVIVFTCNHCPYVIGSEDRIIQFYRDYAPRGLSMAAINSNSAENHPEDSYENMVQRAREKKYPFVYLRDESQDVAKAYGALRTPHFFLFGSERTLQYTGRMDDNPRDAALARTHELRDAVEALLSDRVPPVTATNPIGCNIKWKGRPEKWMPPEACDLV